MEKCFLCATSHISIPSNRKPPLFGVSQIDQISVTFSIDSKHLLPLPTNSYHTARPPYHTAHFLKRAHHTTRPTNNGALRTTYPMLSPGASFIPGDSAETSRAARRGAHLLLCHAGAAPPERETGRAHTMALSLGSHLAPTPTALQPLRPVSS